MTVRKKFFWFWESLQKIVTVSALKVPPKPKVSRLIDDQSVLENWPVGYKIRTTPGTDNIALHIELHVCGRGDATYVRRWIERRAAVSRRNLTWMVLHPDM